MTHEPMPDDDDDEIEGRLGAVRYARPMGPMVPALLGLLVLVAGVFWLGVNAVNTSTAPGYYHDETLYFTPTDGQQRSVPAPGKADTDKGRNSDKRIRVYFDPLKPDDPKAGWHAVWMGPGALIVVGAAGLILAGRLATRGRREDSRAIPR